MSDFAKKLIEEIKEKKEFNAYKHEATFYLNGTAVVDAVMSSWAASIQDRSAAPSFMKINPFRDELTNTKINFTSVITENADGAITLVPSGVFTNLLTELKDVLIDAAKAVDVPNEKITSGVAAIDALFAPMSFDAPFQSGQGPAWAQSFIANVMSFVKEAEHKGVGVIGNKEIESMFTTVPLKQSEIEEEIKNPKPASGVAKYRGYDQMIAAKDHLALEKAIKDSIEMGLWDERRETMAKMLLIVACQKSTVECVKVLLDIAKVDMDEATDNDGHKAIHAAAAGNNLPVLEYLVTQKSVCPNEPNVDGMTPMMIAAQEDAAEAIEKLHSLGADLNEQALDGRTALHWAAAGGEDEKSAPKSINKLLDLGANPNIREYIENALPEDFVDKDNDLAYARTVEYRKSAESGVAPTKGNDLIAKARSTLGF